MKKILFITFVSLSALSFSPEHIEKLKQLKEVSLDDLEHVNKGCPENSVCSALNGQRMLKWQAALDSYAKTNDSSLLQNFIDLNGTPIKYLAKESDVLNKDMILFSSRCAEHAKAKIVEAISFDRPSASSLNLSQIKFNQENIKIPYNTRVLGFIDGSPLLVFVEEDVFLAVLINKKLEYKVINISDKDKLKFIAEKESAECKEQKSDSELFKYQECFKAYDIKTNKTIEVNHSIACY